MNAYASLKGRAATAPKAPIREPSPALHDGDQARVETNRRFVLEHLPELAPLIRALYAEGLIDGWRAVRKCTLKDANQ